LKRRKDKKQLNIDGLPNFGFYSDKKPQYTKIKVAVTTNLSFLSALS
jgi:hypothetical protein